MLWYQFVINFLAMNHTINRLLWYSWLWFFWQWIVNTNELWIQMNCEYKWIACCDTRKPLLLLSLIMNTYWYACSDTTLSWFVWLWVLNSHELACCDISWPWFFWPWIVNIIELHAVIYQLAFIPLSHDLYAH